jgi:SAM-dependent methyltransferase
MNLEEYERMYRWEQEYWWFVARTELLEFAVREWAHLAPDARILDLGCGTGANLEKLARFGSATGIDFSPEALSFCRKRALGPLVRGSGEALGLRSGTYDLVTAMDTLEHMPHDLDALAEAFRVLKPGGRMLVAVPAFGFLWSEHDEALQHRRRYTGRELTAKLELTGFRVEQLTYALFFLFLPVLAMRFLQNLLKKDPHPKAAIRRLPDWLNHALVLLHRLETGLLSWVRWPIGVTVLAVAVKPDPK